MDIGSTGPTSLRSNLTDGDTDDAEEEADEEDAGRAVLVPEGN